MNQLRDRDRTDDLVGSEGPAAPDSGRHTSSAAGVGSPARVGMPQCTEWREVFLGGSPDEEQRRFRDFSRTMRRVQGRVRGKAKAGVLRGLHAKMLAGTSDAELLVEGCELQSGYFVEGRRYPVTLRFSSASSRPGSDGKRDLRGIALRVHQPDGTACDLLMTNAEVSHTRDADEFMAFTSAMAAGVLGMAKLAVSRRGRGAQMLFDALKQTSGKPRSLAAESFWSRAPFLLGERPVRYSLQPQLQLPLDRTLKVSDEWLSADLRHRLAEAELRYVLWAQPYQDEQATPLENSAQRWTTRPIRLATLVIRKQQLARVGSESWQTIDRLTFNPWNALPEMRPIGSLNRARRFVYAASQEERSRPEPAPVEPLYLVRILEAVDGAFNHLNKVVPWHRLHPVLGTLNLISLRNQFRRDSLINLDDPSAAQPFRAPTPEQRAARSDAGTHNDLLRPGMGAAGARFGRNGPLANVGQQTEAQLSAPDPREVSAQLLKRERFIPATTLNQLAVAWIQFQAHDWFKHRETPANNLGCPRQRMATELGVQPTARAAKHLPLDQQMPAAHENEHTHWWDCSQIYGITPDIAQGLRGPGGTLLLPDGLLPTADGALPGTGDNSNWWIGLELIHTLFAREHNAICAALKLAHPDWKAERLFAVSRLVNVALMTKIHTVEWTPALLSHPTLKLSMEGHWYGLLPKWLAWLKVLSSGHSELTSGIPGSPTDHFEVPYAMTEEFVSVYRLHSMLPDQLTLHFAGGAQPDESYVFEDVFSTKSHALVQKSGLHTIAYSLGLSAAGSMCLNNYPDFLRNLPKPDDNTKQIDLGAVDIFRDRERDVPRYNTFRKQLGLPAKKSFAELSSCETTRHKLIDLYGDVDKVDLLVGLLSETPPEGFAISDTAFRIFIGMASRRLKSDRFMTADYREEVYTETGLRWINEGSFKGMLLRHTPELGHILQGVDNPFAPWK